MSSVLTALGYYIVSGVATVEASNFIDKVQGNSPLLPSPVKKLASLVRGSADWASKQFESIGVNLLSVDWGIGQEMQDVDLSVVRNAKREELARDLAEQAAQSKRFERGINGIVKAADCADRLLGRSKDAEMPGALSKMATLVAQQRVARCARALGGISKAAKVANALASMPLPAVPKPLSFRVPMLDAAHQLDGLAKRTYECMVQVEQAPAIHAGHALSRLADYAQQARAKNAFSGISKAAKQQATAKAKEICALFGWESPKKVLSTAGAVLTKAGQPCKPMSPSSLPRSMGASIAQLAGRVAPAVGTLGLAAGMAGVAYYVANKWLSNEQKN